MPARLDPCGRWTDQDLSLSLHQSPGNATHVCVVFLSFRSLLPLRHLTEEKRPFENQNRIELARVGAHRQRSFTSSGLITPPTEITNLPSRRDPKIRAFVAKPLGAQAERAARHATLFGKVQTLAESLRGIGDHPTVYSNHGNL